MTHVNLQSIIVLVLVLELINESVLQLCPRLDSDTLLPLSGFKRGIDVIVLDFADTWFLLMLRFLRMHFFVNLGPI